MERALYGKMKGALDSNSKYEANSTNEVSTGHMITILSIDGGGARGIIAAIILEFVEKTLKDFSNDPKARITDFFDVTAGTSTGALIAAMLAVPAKYNDGQLFTAEDVTEYYLKNCASIFRPPKKSSICVCLKKAYIGARSWVKPKYDGKDLRGIIKHAVGNIKLHEMPTEVVIPAFDIEERQPVAFTTFAAKRDELTNPLLYDVLIGSSAAPTYFPSHSFRTHDSLTGKTRLFNLIDGGVAANDPTSCAINQLIKEAKICLERSKGQDGNVTDHQSRPLREVITSLQTGSDVHRKFRVLSLGTGQEKASYNVANTAKWGQLKWIKNLLIQTFMKSSAHMAGFHASVHIDPGNYLRIQEYELDKEISSLDISKEKALLKLKQIGEKLLDKPVRKMNLDSEKNVEVAGMTNREALTSFCWELVLEKRSRSQQNQRTKQI